MRFVFYPSEESVRSIISQNEPILLLISFDQAETLIAVADEVVEHTIMLRKMNRSELDIDKYYRVVANGSGADWTFVCPSDYKGIKDKRRRIEKFYNDGFEAISKTLKKIGCKVSIEIPLRYRRHLDMIKDNGIIQ